MISISETNKINGEGKMMMMNDIREIYVRKKWKRKLIFKVFIHTLSLLIIKEYIDLH